MKPKKSDHQEGVEPELALHPDLMNALAAYSEALQPPTPIVEALQRDIKSLASPPKPVVGRSWVWTLFQRGRWVMAVAVAACLLLVLQRPEQQAGLFKQAPRQVNTGQPVGGRLLAKGAWQLDLFAIGFQTQYKKKVLVRQRDVLFEGDQIQFVYKGNRGSLRQLLIISTNQRGEHAVYISQKERYSAAFQGSGHIASLPVLELDDYVGWEKIFVFSAAKRFSVLQVRHALDRAFSQAGRHLQKMKAPKGPWKMIKSFQIQKKKKPAHE